MSATGRDRELHVPPHLILHLGRLFESQASEEGLRDVCGEERPPKLCRYGVHQSLAPSRGCACVGGQLSCLQVFETSHHEPSLYDALVIDDLPFKDPSRVNDIRGVFLVHTIEGSEVEPALEFLEHRPVALSLVLKCFIPSQDVLGALDDGLLKPRREHLDHVVLVVAQRWELLTVRRDEQHAHPVRQLYLDRSTYPNA